MDSLTTSLRPPGAAEDRFADIRRRNKQLIYAFFLLIIAVAIITGGIILALIRHHNFGSQSFEPNPAISSYCDSQFSCISFLSYSIQSTPDSTPTQILRLSLETAASRISNLLPWIPESTAQNCSSSLRHSVSQLNNTVEILWADPDEESRMAILEEVTGARNDLDRCLQDLDGVLRTMETPRENTTAAAAEMNEAKVLVDYGVGFLRNFDMVNENFNYEIEQIGGEGLSRIVEDLGIASLYGSCYLVLMFLFCLLLRIY